MKKNYKLISFLFVVVILTSCKERFEPNLPSVSQGYLVVDGYINAQGVTQIKLSRTVPLGQKKVLKPELNATLQIQGEDNTSFPFTATSGGIYSSEANTLNPSSKYRLRIKTKDTKEYLSDYVEVKITPPIDSISWKEEDKGIQIYVTTHDEQNKSIYYRWEYDETWEIQSAFYAWYKYENGKIVLRSPNEPNIYYCWKYDTSRNIAIQSSEKLQKDIISLKPLKFIPFLDDRLQVRYSIQVRQYALDKSGHQFYELLKKNTESLGTIFDPQPSALNGNLHSASDPNELVLGYIGVTTMHQQRIFIEKAQIMARTYSISELCPDKEVLNRPDSIAKYVPPQWPFDAIWEGLGIKAYKVAESWCVDCRERGKNVKPSFW
jgi:hypothetical protein